MYQSRVKWASNNKDIFHLLTIQHKPTPQTHFYRYFIPTFSVVVQGRLGLSAQQLPFLKKSLWSSLNIRIWERILLISHFLLRILLQQSGKQITGIWKRSPSLLGAHTQTWHNNHTLIYCLEMCWNMPFISEVINCKFLKGTLWVLCCGYSGCWMVEHNGWV